MTATYDPGTKHGILEAYATISAKNGGAIKGNSIRDDKKGKIAVLGLEFGAKSPRDLATGQASGRRGYEFVEIEIEMSPAATQLMQALAINDIVTKAEFDIYRHNETGAEEIGTKITIEKGSVASYRFVAGSEEALYPHVRFAFTFDKITVETEKTVMSDSWTMTK